MVRSHLAVVKIANHHDEDQRMYFNYCDVEVYAVYDICIIESHNGLKRYKVLQGETVDSKSVSQLLEGWLKKSIPEYHKVEQISTPFEGNIAVPLR